MTEETPYQIRALGRRVTKFEGFDTFPTPEGIKVITCTTDEVTAVCPVTGQPDWYTVRITYIPKNKCVESKTLKLYLQKYRNEGHFCEQFASIIAHDIYKALDPHYVRVTVIQKPRGGISIEATAEVGEIPE